MVMEFIGAEAVGKSTLCRALHEARRDKWFYGSALNDLVLTDLDHPEDVLDVLKYLFRQRIEQDYERQDLWVMSGMAAWNANVIRKDALMRRRLAKGFLVDEGVVKQFASEILTLAPGSRRALFGGRAIVLVDSSSTELLVARQLERLRDWSKQGKFKHPTSVERLSETAHAMIITHRHVFEAALDAGCPGLHLKIEDGFERNLSKLLAFDGELRQSVGEAHP
jgi:hypothetical protein